MKVRIALLLLLLAPTACAGMNVLESTPPANALKPGSTVLAFPFRDPTREMEPFPGVGARFTNAFAGASARYGVEVRPVFAEQFNSTGDVDVAQAMAYAQSQHAAYFVTGQVTRWVDRFTEWSGKRDFAGLSVSLRDAKTGKLIGVVEIEEHSSHFWSGTPDDFLVSLSQKAVDELFQSSAAEAR